MAKGKTAATRHEGADSKPAAARLLCTQPAPKPVVLPAGLPPSRESAIRISAKKWVNGTVLHYHFLDGTGAVRWHWPEPQKQVVRDAFQAWKDLGVGLSFIEVSDETEAEIVIGFNQSDGSWSLVGTDNLDPDNRDNGRTMNFGWDLTTAWGHATALHEIGHAIGFSHEHQNPKAGIVWNEPAVLSYFSGEPNNWDPVTIRQNILDKIGASGSMGSKWDPASIMEYPFEPGLIVSPKPYDTKGVPENLVPSPTDIQWVRTWYPGNAVATEISVMQLQKLNAAAGQQRDFTFKPKATRTYTIQTIGEADCRLVVFELRNNEPRHLASDDDSGVDANLKLKQKLIKGRTYIIRVRVNFTSAPDGVALLVS